ncbi:hypothetical protein QTP70_006795 [Hemibagrus guttatus]|uniref:Endonuclease/exonuclease/phosphatase domain-containing protein n=1 Tax=Hemibagrus guttatus TaxID=175788 RepID=A0AAE0PWS7_9TELE|nr:hypothetical protein QTP70_006795 [Hemibagrus guttatus]
MKGCWTRQHSWKSAQGMYKLTDVFIDILNIQEACHKTLQDSTATLTGPLAFDLHYKASWGSLLLMVGCELEEKERLWSELDEVMESIPTGERVVIGADFNGHVGEENTGDEEVMGKFGVKERNLERQIF